MKILTSFKLIMASILLSFTLVGYTSSNKIETEKDELMDDDAIISVVRICQFDKHGSFAGGCSPSDYELDIDPNCKGIIRGRTYATNLAANPVVGQVYSLPSGVPAVYVKSGASNGATNPPILYGPFTEYTYNGLTHQSKSGITYHIFEMVFELNFEVSFDCFSQNVSANYLNLPVSISMVTSNGATYPVDSHALPNEVFSCDVFLETCHECGECGGKDVDPIYDGNACGSCGSCSNGSDLVDNSPKDILEQKISSDIEPLNKTTIEKGITIQPNPFTEKFSIQYRDDLPLEMSIEIFDINGKLVHQQMQNVSNQEMVEVQMSSLQSGIYYCKVRTGTKISTKKLIKIN